MIPVQYRDAETEEIIEYRYEEVAPEIGTRVGLDGAGEVRVLYRWRCNPTACVVYVMKVESGWKARVAA